MRQTQPTNEISRLGLQLRATRSFLKPVRASMQWIWLSLSKLVGCGRTSLVKPQPSQKKAVWFLAVKPIRGAVRKLFFDDG